MTSSCFISFPEARPVLSDPDIFPRIAEDGATAEDLLDGDNDLFVGIFSDGALVGVWCLIPVTGTTLDIHVHILKGYRKNKYHYFRQLLELMRDELPSIHKLQCRVPVVFPEIYHYAVKSGFAEEGLETESKVINGQFVDQWILGGIVEELSEAQHGQG